MVSLSHRLATAEETCSICLENHPEGSNVLAHTPLHSFHEICFRGWISALHGRGEAVISCPVCRIDISDINGVVIEAPLQNPAPAVLAAQEQIREELRALAEDWPLHFIESIQRGFGLLNESRADMALARRDLRGLQAILTSIALPMESRTKLILSAVSGKQFDFAAAFFTYWKHPYFGVMYTVGPVEEITCHERASFIISFVNTHCPNSQIRSNYTKDLLTNLTPEIRGDILEGAIHDLDMVKGVLKAGNIPQEVRQRAIAGASPEVRRILESNYPQESCTIL